jgi:hypothetical protein
MLDIRISDFALLSDTLHDEEHHVIHNATCASGTNGWCAPLPDHLAQVFEQQRRIRYVVRLRWHHDPSDWDSTNFLMLRLKLASPAFNSAAAKQCLEVTWCKRTARTQPLSMWNPTHVRSVHGASGLHHALSIVSAAAITFSDKLTSLNCRTSNQ